MKRISSVRIVDKNHLTLKKCTFRIPSNLNLQPRIVLRKRISHTVIQSPHSIQLISMVSKDPNKEKVPKLLKLKEKDIEPKH